ncbi:hypothetical protein PACILC2_22930 [Paenibacillus cisolokensis]|uniref:XkdX family protein n=1 Tax=Paenibacillus cisolokensis TaxID=1658519 RepID=A0ABQ4N6E0_9BACL|nr:XkdX family protein [Paenibacillus cisolokensis]GIQ63725.1 hypothetical protein PACILC2_22930 [Paenibacillus cisolokensis]
MSVNPWFDRIKRFYERNLWTLEMVKDGVKTGVITEAEYKQITGADYVVQP